MREVAVAVGVSPPTIGNWETGVATPRGEAAVTWAGLLDALVAQERAANADAAQTA